MTHTARRLALGLWLAALAGCIGVIAHTRFIADLSAFLPQAPNARQQVLVEQLRDGIIARLIMVGIDGADANERARLSRALAAQLRGDPAFVGVQNGDAETLARDRAYLFKYRYLLSPAVTPQRFTPAGLHTAIDASLQALAGEAGLMLKQLLPRDPTGETLALIEGFAAEAQPGSVAGVWATRDGQRALLLLQTRAAGSDTDGQAAAIARLRASFAALHPQAGARMVISGAGVFSVASRQTIQREVSHFALAGTALVVLLLLAVYRSPRLLGLGLLPVASGALAGVAAVSLGFGHVHGLTLGFGTTLIGEAVDYSIYFFLQRADGRPLRHFWRVIGLGVLTSIAGFAALLCSGFPGLAQLGLYSISGLLTAALVTRFVLPHLITPAHRLRDLTTLGREIQTWVQRAPRATPLLLVLVVAAAASVLAFKGAAIWNRQLNSLSPVSAADQRLDAALRAEMGAPEMRYLVSFAAPSQEAALQGAERIGGVLTQLAQQQVIGGFNSPAAVLPSAAAQDARRAALPAAPQLRANLDAALHGLPIQAARLQGFIDDVEATRITPPLTRAHLDGTTLSMLADALLIQRTGDFLVLLPLRAPSSGTVDPARVERALAATGVKGATAIDLFAESAQLYAGYLHEAILLTSWGGLSILALLLASLRSVTRTLRVAAPLLCAIVCVAAAHVVIHGPMSLLHLIGLLLVAAVGSNYALFFDQGAQGATAAQRRQTLVSLVIANCTTVVSFGLLGFSQLPILAAIGSTVGPGAFLALVFSAILARTDTTDGNPG